MTRKKIKIRTSVPVLCSEQQLYFIYSGQDATFCVIVVTSQNIKIIYSKRLIFFWKLSVIRLLSIKNVMYNGWI